MFGGVTNFQSILGTNLPEFEPVRTTLRHTIHHVIDYGIKPSWANPLGDQNSTLSLEDCLHPLELGKLVLYPTHYSAMGWGARTLSTDELGIAFGLAAWARASSLQTIQIFPFVPIQVMDGCLKGLLSSSPKLTPLHTPLPQIVKPLSEQTWLPHLQKFLSHTWVDANLVTAKAVKRDNAGVPTHLWDKRCTLVLPHVGPALDRLRRLLL
jgi:hypothetical protein